jgi:cytoskeleton protein RodZ
MSSFGEEIRRERELREITLREISEATKISMRYLDALERNDFRHLPGGVFNKGFVRAYAQFIGTDPDAMVNAYLLEEQSQEARARQREGAKRPEHSFSPAKAAGRRSSRLAWAVAALVLLLVVAGIVLGILLLRSRSRGGEEARPAGVRSLPPAAGDGRTT